MVGMPKQNRFHHQPYPTRPSATPQRRRLRVTDGDDADFSRLHTHLGIRRVILVHGTFMGEDPIGVAAQLQDIGADFPLVGEQFNRFAESLLQNTRPATMKLTRDIGNYTLEYQQKFRDFTGAMPYVYLLTPGWSSQNHHLARADLAVRLFLHLHSLELSRDDFVLLWGHSHAGNAFALLSNLLANDRKTVEEFFDAIGPREETSWQTARDLLAAAESPHPLARNLLIVAFGTPVRYGWDTDGYRSLVHILHHREVPVPGNTSSDSSWTTRPLYPLQLPHEVLDARYGDWVQAFGIAGTDTPAPSRMKKSCLQLGEFLENSLPDPVIDFDLKFLTSQSLRFLCARWKTGTRCHEDGLNVLVEYEPSGLTTMTIPIEKTLMGHGVATTLPWLPAHLNLVTEMLSQISGI
jgi:hypothetical protein